jgi:P27 family predicted phage terminase small subunit
MKRLAGNPGHRPLNENEPQPGGIPQCPGHLDKVARKEWRRISKELIAVGLLTEVDRAALAAYCCAWSRWVAAEERIQDHGLVVKAPSGYPVQNPYVGIANTAMDQMRKFLVEFGLTPASRSRLHAEPRKPKAVDPFAEFMESIGGDDSDSLSNDVKPDVNVCVPSCTKAEGEEETKALV